MNLTHLLPVSAVWAGPEKNRHLDGPTLLHAVTAGSTPFRLSFHVGDVGHAMVVGPTGAGKSVLLAVVETQFLRYGDAQVYIFDKGGAARAITAGVGGDFYSLGEDAGGLSFQPLAMVDDELERSWATEWILDLLRRENIDITPTIKKEVWVGLTSLATAPKDQRTISGLMALLQNNIFRQALHTYSIDGPHGHLLDATGDSLNYGRWQCFEMEHLMNTPSAVPAVLSYLFHRLEKRFDGKPSMLVLDEAWIFFDNPIFADQIREWLKVLRKANVSVIFATQSLSDIVNSPIANSLIDSCPTRIFLPNDKALDESTAEIYKRFGLNDRQIRILALAQPNASTITRVPWETGCSSWGWGLPPLPTVPQAPRKIKSRSGNCWPSMGKRDSTRHGPAQRVCLARSFFRNKKEIIGHGTKERRFQTMKWLKTLLLSFAISVLQVLRPTPSAGLGILFSTQAHFHSQSSPT